MSTSAILQRAVANQVFALLSGAVQESTIDLILTQLERRDPEELMADEDEDVVMDDEEEQEGEEAEDDESSSSSSSEDEDDEEEDEDVDEEADLELRRKIEEALRVNGIAAATGESEEETLQRAMRDPEVAAQANPAALQDHMKNPTVRQNIMKLINAGIIKTR
ncbi:hypothetical protein NUW54_g4314 [Trametes sanguinea]|uniref:Uncharacterized protein n=1 Tax=Trametes sanguinea TaxID=158606 RepID=A0ACC1Q122_9APHY|nr:hypothetical protein NUW54_g4314 [Trametes sanguinea]